MLMTNGCIGAIGDEERIEQIEVANAGRAQGGERRSPSNRFLSRRVPMSSTAAGR